MALITRAELVKGIHDSRAKDHQNPFRKMVYSSKKEMDKVIGSFSENSFIKEQVAEMKIYRKKASDLIKLLIR